MATKKQKKFQPKPPITEVSFSKSGDGKWFISRTIITEIKPVSYIEKVLE